MDEKISNEQIGRLVDICNQDTPVEAFILAFRWTFPQIASELLAVRQRITELELLYQLAQERIELDDKHITEMKAKLDDWMIWISS